MISHQLYSDSFEPISCTYRASISRLSGAKTKSFLNIFSHYDRRFDLTSMFSLDIICNIFIWVNPICLPLIIFFLSFKSRECLYLNIVFFLIISLHRFKVPAIFLYCDDKFLLLYWPDELSLRYFSKGSQPLCWLVC